LIYIEINSIWENVPVAGRFIYSSKNHLFVVQQSAIMLELLSQYNMNSQTLISLLFCCLLCSYPRVSAFRTHTLKLITHTKTSYK